MQHWRIDGLKSISCFTVLSFALAWLVALPLWQGGGLHHPQFTWIAMAMMVTPTIAAVAVSLLQRRGKQFIKESGLAPIRKPKRFLLAVLLAYLIPILLIVQAPFIGTWLGVFPGDFDQFMILKFVSGTDGPVRYLLGQAGLILVAGLLNLIPALGEEIGWRGWLWPKLQPLGQVPALLISGVIWGLWHSPLILLGYNYPFAKDGWGVVMMCGMCIVVGAFFAWLRTLSNSVWPAAFAHGIFNASVGLVSLFMIMGSMLDTTKASILGWSGWILPVVVIVLMVLAGAFRATKSYPQMESNEPSN
ncbi:abortive infection protein [Glutamicibacter ardleyensis]|uniref:Abortive infection protein n=2 Tax=Glutamicibacter ardleyensis TaxID=225894 RepID=A0ABQ2DVA3_9MICC|nr:abortive infection protein [Glutamicibacter ardleyensis]